MDRLDPRTLGRNLRVARVRAGYTTQAALAEAARLADETISRIERGAYEPALSTIVSLATLLDTTIDALLGRNPTDPPKLSGPLRRLVRAAETLDTESVELLANVADALAKGRRRRRATPR